MKATIFSPQYRAEERKDGARLINYLRAHGVECSCSFFDSEIAEIINFGAKAAGLSRLSLAYDIYNMYNSDCVVGILNGTDEGILVKLGIAFILGIPVYLFKYDVRVRFVSGENSMVLGLSEHKPITDAKKLVKRIMRAEGCGTRVERGSLSGVMSELLELGSKVAACVKEGSSLIDIAERLKEEVPVRSAPTDSEEVAFHGKVYCSGPLFSPDEHREMLAIAKAFEQRGISAYLPQRDGVEPFVLDSMAGPLAGELFTKPFVNIINKIIFAVDVKELLDCEHFICNLNGRCYDEGAMVEAGMAFAAGKPIALYLNDQRSVFVGGIHSVLDAIAAVPKCASDANTLVIDMENAARLYGAYSGKTAIAEPAVRIARVGARTLKLLSKLKIPRNKMLVWLEDYDENE